MQLKHDIWTYKGNYYRVTSTVGSFKHPDTRGWVPAVHYESVFKNDKGEWVSKALHYMRETLDFINKFEPVEE